MIATDAVKEFEGSDSVISITATFSPSENLFSRSSAVSMHATGCDPDTAILRRPPHAFGDQSNGASVESRLS